MPPGRLVLMVEVGQGMWLVHVVANWKIRRGARKNAGRPPPPFLLQIWKEFLHSSSWWKFIQGLGSTTVGLSAALVVLFGITLGEVPSELSRR